MTKSDKPETPELKAGQPGQQAEELRYSLNEAQRHFGIQANGRVWQLLEKENRSQREDDELLYAAYASTYHWLQVGQGVHQQRGEYLIAKALLSLNQPGSALLHARRCMQLTESFPEQMADFDMAYAHEGLARAHAANANLAEARKHYQLARQQGDQIKNSEDKAIFEADFEGGNWHGIT